MRKLEQAGGVKGKKVFLRVDFDVPVANGSISEPFRIKRQKETLHYLLDQGAKIVMAAHISAVPSFEPLKPQLEQLLDIKFGDGVTLLENTRANPGEEQNDEDLASELVAGCDIYVNNAFAVCHREHASVVAAAKLLPAYAGFLVIEETERLSKLINAPKEGKVVLIGGAKASTKIPVIKYLLDKAQAIAVGGVVANDILAGQTDIDTDNIKLHVPIDFVMGPDAPVRVDDSKALDIGPQTISAFISLVRDAKLVIWNGPMGVFEDERFMTGTKAVAEAIAASPAVKLIGGGDTITAVDKLGLLSKMGFVSTGGGAMLAFLAGQTLPGLKALGYYD